MSWKARRLNISIQGMNTVFENEKLVDENWRENQQLDKAHVDRLDDNAQRWLGFAIVTIVCLVFLILDVAL